MREVQLSQGFSTLIDDSDLELTVKYSWHVLTTRGLAYARAKLPGDKSVYLHDLLMKPPLGMVVDHKDRNGLNNQRHNLRVCTQGQNMHARGLFKNNTTGYKGVSDASRINPNKPFVARICYNYKDLHLGYFKTAIE